MLAFEVTALFVTAWVATVGYGAFVILVLWAPPPPPKLPSGRALTILHLRSHLAHLPHDAVPGALALEIQAPRGAGRLALEPPWEQAVGGLSDADAASPARGRLSRADLEGCLSPAASFC